MNVVKVEYVNHCVVETTIAVMVKYAKTLFAQLAVDQMVIALEIWFVLVKNVKIHAKIQMRVARMPIVLYKIIEKLAFVQIIWSAIR